MSEVAYEERSDEELVAAVPGFACYDFVDAAFLVSDNFALFLAAL